MDDTKRILVLTHFGRVLIIDNGKNRGTVVTDFGVAGTTIHAQAQRLTGGCKICKAGNVAYVGLYGGRIAAISGENIIKNYWLYGKSVSGAVPSCVSSSKFGFLLAGVNIISSSASRTY